MAAHVTRKVTPDDYSSIPGVMSWFIGVTILISVAVKVATTRAMKRSFASDDITIVLSLAFAIAMMVAVVLEVPNGLGKRENNLSPSQIVAYQKAAYVADMMYIFSIAFSKVSVLILLPAIASKNSHRVMVYGTAGLIGLWSLSSLFTTAFQCPLPHPWLILGDKCLNQDSFWMSFGVLNIITEAALIALPIIIISQVQIPASRKLVISAIFAIRIFVIIPIIAELSLRHMAQDNSDRTFDRWSIVVCIELVQGLSIITANIPYLKPFFESLDSGLYRIDHGRTEHERSDGGYRRSTKKSVVTSSKGMKITSPNESSNELNEISSPDKPSGAQNFASAEFSEGDLDEVSIRSTSRIIRATTTYGVHIEPARG